MKKHELLQLLKGFSDQDEVLILDKDSRYYQNLKAVRKEDIYVDSAYSTHYFEGSIRDNGTNEYPNILLKNNIVFHY